MKKYIIGALLLVSFTIATFIIICSLISPDKNGNISFGNIAGGLAVITAIIIILSSYNLITLQENEFKPNPMFKVKTDRYELFQLALINYGKSTAYDLRIEWANKIINQKDDELFNETDSIAALLPEEEISQYVGIPKNIIEKMPNKYEGNIFYKDIKGKKYTNHFIIDFGKYKKTLIFENEQVKAYRELQKLPAILDELVKKLP